MKLEKKDETLALKVKHLEEKNINTKTSRQIAIEDVNSTIDRLVELLETRRTSLLTDIDMKTEVQLKDIDQALDSTTTLLAKVKSSTEYTKEMRERADKVEDLQLMVSATDILNTMLQEKSQDVPFDRTGVTFAPVGVTKMKSLIDVLGSVQTVTFTQTVRPPRAQAGSLYNFVSITPADNYQVTGFVQMFEDGTRTFSPHLEHDLNTASADLKFSEGGVSNMRPEPARDTGCRLTSGGQTLTLRPLSLWGGELVVFSTKVDLTVKELHNENVLIWETAVTSSPVDTNLNQPKGLSVWIGKCLCHKQTLCLLVRFDDKLLHDISIDKYEVGEPFNTHLCIVIDKDASKIHLGDVKTAKVVKTLSDVKFERPPWVMLHVDEASKTKITTELVSGERLIETPGIKQLLSSLE